MMQLPLQITFRDMPHSDSIEQHVRRRAAKLDVFFDRIMACRVAVQAPHRRHLRGKRYHVRIDLTVPGTELAVGRNPPEHLQHEDLHAAVDDAFDDAQRVLEDYARRLRGDVKLRKAAPHGIVVKLLPESGYGFIEDADGVELYFHQNSVLDGRFGDLRVGTEVRYAEELGDKGPQASTIAIVGKSGHSA
jgi:cold shock CspA family protein/ribosome-associated translation inhibitor RaiA